MRCSRTRPLSYLLTANRIEHIRPEILSRMKVVRIHPPTLEQMPAVVRSVDRALRHEYPPIGQLFAPLDAEFIAAMAARPPREIRQLLWEAYAGVAEQGGTDQELLALRTEHLPQGAVEHQVPRRTIKLIPLWVDPGSRRVH